MLGNMCYNLFLIISFLTLLTQGISLISWSYYPINSSFFVDFLAFRCPFAPFSLSSSPSLCLFLSSHGESALTFSLLAPSYLLSSLSVFAIIVVLELSYLPVILGYMRTDTHAHTHACWVTPLLRNVHLNSTLPSFSPTFFSPHFFTSSFMPGLLFSPLFRLPSSFSLPELPLHDLFPHITPQCVIDSWPK